MKDLKHDLLVELLRIPTTKFPEEIERYMLEDPLYQASIGPSTLKADLRKLVGMEEYSDVKFKIDGTTIPAHLCLLIARNCVFSTMFESGMREAESRCVEIDGVSLEAFTNVLFYMYSGSLGGSPSFAGYVELLTVADRYLLEELKQECARVLAAKVQPSNSLSVLSVADGCNLVELRGKALDIISRHFHQISTQIQGKSER